MKDARLTLSGAANFLGIHPKTMQKMDRTGKLKACRTSTNRRYYLKSELQKIRSKMDSEKTDHFTADILRLVKKYYRRQDNG